MTPGADAATDSVEFLRRSLEDLDAELAAGDLSPEDHARLRDDYTARLARALRGAAPPTASPPGPSRPARPWAARVLVGAVVVVFAVGAGLLVARTSGTRTSQDALTGDIRASQRAELDRCPGSHDLRGAGHPRLPGPGRLEQAHVGEDRRDQLPAGGGR